MRVSNILFLPCAFFLLAAGCIAFPVLAQEPPAGQSVSPAKPHPEVQALLDKAAVPAKEYRWADALKGYEDALTKAKTLQDRVGEAFARSNIGFVYASLDQHQKALEQYHLALALYRAAGNRAEEANTYRNIGVTHASLGQPKAALDNYQQALSLYRMIRDRLGEAGVLNNLGNIYLDTGQPQKAFEHFQEAQTLFRAIGDTRGEATAHTNIGRAYFFTNQIQKALDQYKKTLPLFQRLKEKRGEAISLTGIGGAYASLGQPHKALEHFRLALPLFRSVRDSQGEASVLTNIGIIYADIGQPQKALENHRQALRLCKAIGDRQGEAATLHNLGNVYVSISQPLEALEQFLPALSLYKAVGDKQGEANVLLSLGNVYKNTDQLQSAMGYYMQALSIFNLVEDRQGTAIAYNNMGAVYAYLSQPQKALEHYQKALTLERELGDRQNMADTLTNLGNIYSSLGQPQRALDYYAETLRLYKAIGNRQGEGRALNNLGNIYKDIGRSQNALACYRRALPVFKQVQDRNSEAGAHFNIGHVYAILRRPKQALGLYERALTIFKAVGDRRGEAGAFTNMGLACADMGQTQKALKYFQKARTIHRDIGNRYGEALTLTYYGNTYRKTGQSQKALHQYRQAVALTEQYRQDIGANSESKRTYLASILDLYYHAITLLLEQKQSEEAFALVQKTKARSLLDLVAYGQVDFSAALTPQEREQEQQLRQQTFDLNRQMVNEGVQNRIGARKRFAALQRQLRQSEARLQAFTNALYAAHPGLADRRIARTATLSDIARFLPQDTALLEYIQVSQNKLALFVIRTQAGKARMEVYSLPTQADDLLKRCAAFRDACSNPRKSWDAQARRLYRLLIQPAERSLTDAKRLIICPDGPLWGVAFGALADGKRQPLFVRFSLSMAYSATGAQVSWLARQNMRSAASAGLLVMANPNFGTSQRFGGLDVLPGQRPFDTPSRPFDTPSRPLDSPSRPLDSPSRQMLVLTQQGNIKPLPGTQQEADHLSKLFPSAHVYTGLSAQEGTAKQEMERYRYLHFATHGFFNDASPMLSSLVLAQPETGSEEDGFLTAREVYDLKLSAELAVLSACNTGRGEQRSGEGIVGLTWALLAAGCPSAVVSGWSVDDASTATLMGRFYANLKAGKSKASALREAALALRKDGMHGHPYYWAAFFLVGDGR